MPSEKKQRRPFVANLQSGVNDETYAKVLNKLTNRDQRDQEDREESAKSSLTRPIVSLANNELSQASLANDQLSQSLAKPIISLVNGYRTPNYLDDEIMPTLQPSEQLVLRRLYRLAYGFNRDTTDKVSLTKLAEKCNLGVATVKLAIKSLEAKRLIEIQSDQSRDPKGGNRYRVLAELITSNDQLGQSLAKLIDSHIKDDDHDDLNNTDHHQSGVMMIYQQLTGNSWTKLDQATYEKIKNIPLEKIEQAIRLASQRAASRPNSLNYFVKEILNLVQPSGQSKTQRKKVLEKIVTRVRDLHVGATNYKFPDFVEDVKREAAREGMPFDNDLFNQIIGM